MGDSQTKVFVREATGLIRNLSFFDTISSNFAIINIASALTFPVLLIAVTFPHANIPLAILITIPPILAYNGLYSYFARAMPRSGGEYVYISRILNPGIGFAANFSFAALNMFYVAYYGNSIGTIGLSALFYSLGLKQNNQSLVNLGSTLATPAAGFAIGTVAIVVFSALAIWGVRKVFTVQNIMVVIGVIGTIAMITVIAAADHTAFVSTFNQYGSYDKFVNASSSAGFTPSQSTSWSDTILATGLVALTLLFGQYSIYVGGEVKQSNRNLPPSIFATTFITAGFMIGAILVANAAFGSTFIGASQALFNAGDSAYPFAIYPYYNFLASLLTNNAFLISLMGLGYALWTAAGLSFNIIANSRCTLAWSFDRVFPDMFAKVSDRFHTPANAIILTAVFSELLLVLYSFELGYVSFFFGTTLAYVLAFAFTAISGIVFPFRKSKRHLYEGSGADRKVAGIPVITVLGIATLAYFIVLSYGLFTNAAFNANSPTGLLAIASFWIIGLAIFVCFYFYRKRKGIRVSLAYADIPPE